MGSICIVLSGCAGGTGEQAAESEATTNPAETSTAADTGDIGATTETGPPPITADEKQWAEEIERVAKLMNREIGRVHVYTGAAMTRLAKTFSTCLRSLKRAGEPGRMQPAARMARRACEKFQKSADAMRKAMAMEAGIDSQAEADQFSALLDIAIEAQGNGTNVLEEARLRAVQIRESLPSE
jgi:hypothetical protein